MSLVKGFKGIRFNDKKVDLKTVTAPPYDVFEYGDPLDTKLKSDENNIAHIQKPVGDGDSKYENAAKIFQQKIEEQILIQDNEDNFYIYQQEADGVLRTGIIAAVKLDETYTTIKRHEKTKDGPKVDRLKLTKSTGLNIGLVFTVFRDSDRKVFDYLNDVTSSTEAIYEFEYPTTIKNRLWKITDTDLTDLLKNKTLYIADGHHRYQTMVDYRNYLRDKYNTTEQDDAPYEYAMIFNVPDVDLTILPYNRVIKNIEPARFENFIEKIKENFKVEEINDENVYVPPKDKKMGMYYNGKNYILSPNNSIINENSTVDSLDVSILQDYILNPILGIDEDKLKSGKFITYPKGESDINDIKKLVDNENHQVGFSLYPTSIQDLMDVADENLVMPQKSTYFYPKLLTGMVLYQSEKK